MRFSRRSIVRAVLGIGISVVASWLVLRSVDLAAAADILRTADPIWIAVMFITVFLDVASRGGRWRVLLAPIASLPYRRVLGYTYIGYLANNVLPARLGELVRSHSLGEKEGIPRATVLGTVVVERVVDTVVVVAIASLSVLVLSIRGVMTSAVLLGLAFASLLVIGLGIGSACFPLLWTEKGLQMAYIVQAVVLLVSGVYYPTTVLPEWLQPLSVISPATYVIEGMRRALLDGADLVALWPLVWPALLIGLLSIPIGLRLFIWAERYAKKTGRLKRSG